MKDNRPVDSVDLGAEVSGNGGGKLSFFMGRSDDCHVVLNDQQVSREHAEFIFENNVWKIKQVSEYGQLIVNNAFVQEKELNSGDVITIGPFVVWVALSDAAIATPNEEVTEGEEEPSIAEGEGATETVALSTEEGGEALEDDMVDEFGDENEADTETLSEDAEEFSSDRKSVV